MEAHGVPCMPAGWLSYPYVDPRPFRHVMAVLAREQADRPPPVDIPFACPPPGGRVQSALRQSSPGRIRRM